MIVMIYESDNVIKLWIVLRNANKRKIYILKYIYIPYIYFKIYWKIFLNLQYVSPFFFKFAIQYKNILQIKILFNLNLQYILKIKKTERLHFMSGLLQLHFVKDRDQDEAISHKTCDHAPPYYATLRPGTDHARSSMNRCWILIQSHIIIYISCCKQHWSVWLILNCITVCFLLKDLTSIERSACLVLKGLTCIERSALYWRFCLV